MLTAERKEYQSRNEHNILFLETNSIIKQEGIFCECKTGCFFLNPFNYYGSLCLASANGRIFLYPYNPLPVLYLQFQELSPGRV
jgi:hypothetical protein